MQLPDVREPTQFGIAHYRSAPACAFLNISLVGLKGGRLTSTVSEESAAALTRVMEAAKGGTLPIYVLCRRGGLQRLHQHSWLKWFDYVFTSQADS